MLCGPAGSGKSTWASKHFLPTQVVSSDKCRGLVFDDPADQGVSADAFDLMHFIIDTRLRLGRLTIADATNLRREHRRALTRIARRHHFNSAAVVFDMPLEICLRRNAARERRVPQAALMSQYSLLERTLRTIRKEGFNYVYVLDEPAQSAAIVRIGRYVSPRLRQPVT
ncbi:MAG TPA: AAA family ATPase [Blastocatellia bacterium]|nr:AAA family ATPase [Blastocatellia bacterium]